MGVLHREDGRSREPVPARLLSPLAGHVYSRHKAEECTLLLPQRPFPPGTHRMHTSCLKPEKDWGKAAVWLLWRGVSAPLPLVGRGEGWGESLSAGRVSIDFRQLLLLMPIQENLYLSDGCGLRAPHPLPLPTRGRGAEGPCHHAGAFFFRASNVNTAPPGGGGRQASSRKANASLRTMSEPDV